MKLKSSRLALNITVRTMGCENFLIGPELLATLAEHDIISSAIGRQFYSKEYLERWSIHFPEDLKYEDIGFSFQALINCEKICYLNKVPYLYLDRSDSVSHDKVSALNVHSMYEHWKLVDCYWEKHLQCSAIKKYWKNTVF